MAEDRDYQQVAIRVACDFIDSPATPAAEIVAKHHATRKLVVYESRNKLLVASPTGTGKSYVMLRVQDARPGCWIVVPNVSIVYGFLRKRGFSPESEADLWELARVLRITTPLRFKNLLVAGELDPARIPALLIDEAHHDEADTYKDLHVLCGRPAVGFTATPYRGTPLQTAEFRRSWGEPFWMLTIPEAVSTGLWLPPESITWPLVDDDEIEVRSGQLVASQIEGNTAGKLDDLLDRMQAADLFAPNGHTRRGTCVTMPSGKLAHVFRDLMHARGLHAGVITDETPWREREAMFKACRSTCVVQVRTIGEGTDLPLSVMIDASPTLSGLLWMQRFGRVTGTGRADGTPLYVCTNRNYLRHSYLLGGAMPEMYLRNAVTAFGGLGDRGTAGRAFGLQSLGRLQPVKINTTHGYPVHTYAVGALGVDYLVVVHPRVESPVWFERRYKVVDGTKQREEWELLQTPPEELKGYKSCKPYPLTPPQLAWWNRDAANMNIDPTQKVDARVFQILPPLAKYRLKL